MHAGREGGAFPRPFSARKGQSQAFHEKKRIIPSGLSVFFVLLNNKPHKKHTEMKANAQTIQQIERALRKVAAKYPSGSEPQALTDIHLQVKAESGELLAFNDEDEELTRCVVAQWIDNKDENFYKSVVPVLRQCMQGMKETLESMSILKPYSFVLIDDEKETVSELYLVDDEAQILDGELLKGLDKELDEFLKKLLDD